MHPHETARLPWLPANWAYRLFPPRHVERILLNLMLTIGDTLFVMPTIHALRQRFPAAHIAARAHILLP